MADPKAQTVGKPFEADASFSGYALAHLTLDSSLNSRYWSAPTGATIVSERTEHTENLFTFIVDAVCEEAADDIYLEFYDVLAMSYEDVLFEVRLTLISNLFNCLAPLPPGILPPAPQPKRVPSGEEH